MTLPSWNKVCLSDVLSSVEAGISVNGDDKVCGPNDFGVLKVSAVSTGAFDPSEAKCIKEAEITRARLNPKKDHIIFSRANTPELVGASAYVTQTYPNLYLPDKLWLLSPKSSTIVNMRWLALLLGSPFMRKRIGQLATGTSSSMKNISQEELLNLEIFLPSFSEQKAIAAILSIWDEAIEKTKQLIFLKELVFRSLQNNLINKNLKFQSKFTLRDVARIPDRKKLETLEGKQLLTVKLHCMGIEANDRIKPKISDSGRPYYSRKYGEILIGRQNFHNGGIGIVPEDLDGGIASNAITSIEGIPGKLYQKFLYWFLSREIFYQKVGNIMGGTGQKELSERQLLNLSIHLPPLPQQIEISNMLDNAKEELRLFINILEKLNLQKQGLMQKLLTGKWRVNFKEEK